SGAPDGEFLITRTHKGLARPFAAAVIIDCVDVVETRREISAKQRFAITGRNVPPAFRRPALAVLVTERDPDATLSDVANTQIGGGRCGGPGCSGHDRKRQHAKAQQTRTGQTKTPQTETC